MRIYGSPHTTAFHEPPLGIWTTMIILQNNYLEIWATLDLSPVAISQNMELAVILAGTTSRYF